jgi:hypothetical protein
MDIFYIIEITLLRLDECILEFTKIVGQFKPKKICKSMHDIVLKCFIICKTNIGTIQGSLISQRLIVDTTKFNGYVTLIQLVI